MPINTFTRPNKSYLSRTASAYLLCPEVPGKENTDNGAITEGHSVFKYRFSMSKSVKPGNNGLLASTGQVSVSDFKILIDQEQAEAFKAHCGKGTVFPKITIIVVSNYGATGATAQPKFVIELEKARIAEAIANVPYVQYDYVGPTGEVHAVGEGAMDSSRYDGNFFNNLHSMELYLLELSFVFTKGTLIYHSTSTSGEVTGQIATSFDVTINQIAAG